jgi:hypothetical protein
LVAPATWAVDTLGHATSGTFPAGGPESAATGGPGGFGGGLGGGPGGGGSRGGFPGAGRPGVGSGGGATSGAVQLFGSGGTSQSGSTVQQGVATGAGGQAGAPPAGGAGFAAGGGPGGGGGGGAIGAPLGNSNTIAQAIAYTKSHGGGTVAVASQSSAASAIIDDGADVAGIGGFSGRESTVSISWLADEVAAGKIRWVLDEGSASGVAGGGAGAGRLPGDTRKGSSVAIAAAAKVCRKVTLTGGATSSTSTLYDCQGRASQLLSTQQSKS